MIPKPLFSSGSVIKICACLHSYSARIDSKHLNNGTKDVKLFKLDYYDVSVQIEIPENIR
jgi:hypothetical protein